MRGSLSYSVAVLLSLLLHAGVVAAFLVDWQPETERVIMQPQYIEAKLVALAPKVKTEPAKPKVDLAAQRLKAPGGRTPAGSPEKGSPEKSRGKKRQAQEKDAEERERKEKQRQEELQRQQEAERKQAETEFAEALAAEQALIKAQKDEQAANSYRQQPAAVVGEPEPTPQCQTWHGNTDSNSPGTHRTGCRRNRTKVRWRRYL